MPESIFKSALRTFFVALFGVAGVILGVILIFAFAGGISSSIDGMPELNYSFTPEVVSNAEGVRKVEGVHVPVILKININGVIGLDSLTRKSIAQLLIESRERSLEDRVKGILLCIDSPGGTVIDADGIYRELMAYKEQYKVPIYAYVDGFCASGGLYIACAADKIFASDTSLIGSVGVLLPTLMNFSQVMEKIGLQSLTLYDGKGKDNLNPFRPWKKGEEANIQDSIDYYYKMFVHIVTSRRPGMNKEDLVEKFGADVYPAEIAKQHGYIDESGFSINQALKLLVDNIPLSNGEYQVVKLDNSNWLTQLFGSQSLFSGKVTHHLAFIPELPSELSNQYLYLYRP